MEETCKKIKALMPYKKPFLFVDEITAISDQAIEGNYRYREDEFFYEGHFPGNPVTPGVIMTETMAQIGLLGLGIYLTQTHKKMEPLNFVFSSSEVAYLKVVYPGERVVVKAEKVYFRLGKLKCQVVMRNEADEAVCRGSLSGIITDRMLKPNR